MKQLLLAVLMITTMAVDSFAADPVYEVTRDRRRLGYKTVTQCTGCEGRNTLNCEDPGLTGCRPSSIVTVGGTVLTGVLFETIDLMVETQITLSVGAPGKFVHAGLVVTYRYLEESGKINYTIYSLQDAIDLGIIPNINN